jgi:prepilin signal peptidase PulO-like enzyme (type II secretory pathway)
VLDGGLTLDRLSHSTEAFFVFLTGQVPQILARLALALPVEAWWLPVPVLLLLGFAALYDALEGYVPDPLVLAGILIVTAAQGFYADWPSAAQHLLTGLAAAMALWGVNQLYYLAAKRDALGMGDAKWTVLAVAAFGIKPALWAWVIGAWLGLGWMAIKKVHSIARKLAGAPSNGGDPHDDYIHFAPFLFLGLLVGLYWNYLR